MCLAQVLVLADVVDGNRRAQATTRAGKYLMTFSDDYLDRCLMREAGVKLDAQASTLLHSVPKMLVCGGVHIGQL